MGLNQLQRLFTDFIVCVSVWELALCGVGWKVVKDGNMDIANLPCSTRPRADSTECNKQKVEEWSVMVRKLQYNLELDTSMQKKMLILGYQEVCCWWFLVLVTRWTQNSTYQCGRCKCLGQWFATECCDWWWKPIPPFWLWNSVTNHGMTLCCISKTVEG
jgi:hypothetical protein